MYRKVRGRIRVGTNGYSGRKFPGQDYLTKAKNVVYDDAILRMIGGCVKYDASAVAGAPIGLGAAVWDAINDRNLIVSAWNNGKVYLEDAGDIDATEIKDWGTQLIGPVDMFKAGEEASGEGKKLFVLAPEQEPFFIEGNSSSPQSLTASADWSGSNQPSAGTMHDSRAVVWGNDNFPHNIYFSKVDAHDVFTGSGTYVASITPGIGNEVRACVSFATGALYIFKDEGVFAMDTSTIATASYLPVVTYSRSIGIAGPKAWDTVGGDLWFLDQNGMLRSLQAVDASSDVRDSNIFLQLNMQDWVKQNVNKRRLQYSEVHYDEEKGKLFISVPGKTSDSNDIRIIVDLQDKSNPRVSFDIGRGALFGAGFFYKEKSGENRLYYLGGDGFVWKTDAADKDVDGTAYTAVFRTSQEDFRYLEPILQTPMADTKKRFDSLTLSIIGTENASINVQPYIDGVAYGTGFTILLNGNEENMILTTDSQFDLTDSLLTSDVENISRVDHLERIGGRGRYISLEFSSTSDFKVLEAYVNFAIQGIRGIG